MVYCCMLIQFIRYIVYPHCMSMYVIETFKSMPM